MVRHQIPKSFDQMMMMSQLTFYKSRFISRNVNAYFKTHVISLLPRLSLHVYIFWKGNILMNTLMERKVILKLCDIIIY